MRLKSKKAQAMAVYLVLITIVVMGMALATFFNVKEKMSKTISPPSELLEVYDENAKAVFYEDEAARLSSQAAYDSITKEISSGMCSMINLDYVLWSSSCKPNNAGINEKFLKKFNELYYLYSKINMTSISMSNKIIRISSNAIDLNASHDGGYVAYNATFAFNPSFDYNLSKNSIDLGDFEYIYSLVMQCKDKNITKTNECLYGKLERWDFSANSFDKYILFVFKAKKSFWIKDKFTNPELKAAAEI